MSEALNPFKIAQQQLDAAAERLGLDAATHELLRWPMQELKVTLPVRMDDGSTRIFHGFRVAHNTARGPAKGGLRWHPDETIDTVRALATWMTWKTAVCGRKRAPGAGLCAGRGPCAGQHPGCPGPRRLHHPPDHGLDAGRV